MAFNDRKIIKVLVDEAKKVEERCQGYREEITSLLAEILNLERTHAIGKINISQKIGDQINTVGMYLHKQNKKNHNAV